MSAKPAFPKRAQLLLPGVVVGLVYTAFCAVPQHRELRRVNDQSYQHAAAIDQLRLRVNTLSADADLSDLAPHQLTGTLEPDVLNTKGVVLERTEHTFVQAFAQVLAVFRSQGVDCTAAKPNPGDQLKHTTVAQRVWLIGSFDNVLAALERIETEVPSAMAAELSMERKEPAAPCRWEIIFRFKEDEE